MIDVMLQKAQKRFGESMEENSVLAEATLLDPRFKKKDLVKIHLIRELTRKLFRKQQVLLQKIKSPWKKQLQ